MELWLAHNWQWVLLGFMVAEKAVKLTPTPYDDILIDVTGDIIKRITGKSPDTKP